MNKLNTRQWLLKKYLLDHFRSGEFITIEEICANVCYSDGVPCYQLNTNPYNHDKCACLSNDVRTINWSVDEGWKIIIKDTKGNVKLCESQEEFEEWRERELKPLEKKWKYLNNLVFKAKREGTMPFLNQKLNPVGEELTPIDVFVK